MLPSFGVTAPMWGFGEAEHGGEARVYASEGFEGGARQSRCRKFHLKRSDDSEEILKALQKTTRSRLHLRADAVAAYGFTKAVPEEPIAPYANVHSHRHSKSREG